MYPATLALEVARHGLAEARHNLDDAQRALQQAKLLEAEIKNAQLNRAPLAPAQRLS